MGRVESAYIDGISVNEDVVPATRVRKQSPHFGLECKDPERLEDSAWATGLAVAMECSKLQWKRGSKVPDTPDIVTQRTVLSLSEKLVGHLPVFGWLRVACGILKKRASSVMKRFLGFCRRGRSGPWGLMWGRPGPERVGQCMVFSNQ